MNKETQTNKDIFDLCFSRLDISKGDWSVYRTDNNPLEDEFNLVVHHSNGYRIVLTKEKYVNPKDKNFSWQKLQLNPLEFDENGFRYEYYSDVEESGYIDICNTDFLNLITKENETTQEQKKQIIMPTQKTDNFSKYFYKQTNI